MLIGNLVIDLTGQFLKFPFDIVFRTQFFPHDLISVITASGEGIGISPVVTLFKSWRLASSKAMAATNAVMDNPASVSPVHARTTQPSSVLKKCSVGVMVIRIKVSFVVFVLVVALLSSKMRTLMDKKEAG